MDISIGAETLFRLGTFPVTNTILVTLGISFAVMLFSVVLQRRLVMVPRGAQNVVEVLTEWLWNLAREVTGDRALAMRIFPLVATIFFFVLLSNWTELIPGLGTVGLRGHEAGSIIPFLRSGSADMNLTVALALIAVFSVQFVGITTIGLARYASKFLVAPWHYPYVLGSVIGLLELVSEAGRILSFSFRLFGNIFAGEVLLIVMLHLVPYFIPLPFLFLELFAGAMQAFIFAMLTLVFLKMATVEVVH